MRRVALEPRRRVIQPPLEFVATNLVFPLMVRGPLLILRLEDAVSIAALALLVLAGMRLHQTLSCQSAREM